VDKVLYAEQRKADFLPRDTSAVAFDKPTNACLMVTAMLAALRVCACDRLGGKGRGCCCCWAGAGCGAQPVGLCW
jgi:hypothetical protein